MERRKFLGTTALALALSGSISKLLSFQQTKGGLIKPPVLKPGDTIGIIAPGTAVSDPEDLAQVKEVAKYFNLKYIIGKYVESGSGYKTRKVAERLDDLHSMFKSPDISAVICIRGGHGSAHLLDGIDYDLIRKNPKIFIGYSDITAMHLAIQKHAGIVTFHGPMMLSTFTKYTIGYFQKAMFSPLPIGELNNPPSGDGVHNPAQLRVIVPGKATGKTTGGNLSLITSLIGTPYEIDTKDKIFFVEDVGEEPYRIDRMMMQLKLSGKLDAVAGIVIGKCEDCNYSKPSRVWDDSLGEVFNKIFENFKKPVIYGLMFGHTADQLTIPLGVEASIDTDNLSISINETATSI
jgi:muramoyltetrapeptide carboxypeptidase